MRIHQFLTAGHQSVCSDFFTSKIRSAVQLVFLFSLLTASSTVVGQLGVYAFTGAKDCPTQNPNVTSQPANAVFSVFSTVNADCKDQQDNECNHERWNRNTTINLTEYHQFSVTANVNYVLNLTSFSFRQFTKDEDNGTTQWILRSSIDNYTTNLGTGLALENAQTPTVSLPVANFTGITTATFRIYLVDSKDDGNEWTVDNVSLFGSVTSAIATPPNPTSDSPQCANPGVTLSATGTPPAGETWYWQNSPTGTSTANSASTYIVTTSGTYYIRSQDNTTLAWSGAGSISVTVTPDVSAPVFILGANSTRCDIAGNITYTATAANSSNITYSLDAASLAAGNSIDGLTGVVTYITGWTDPSIITASADGCNGPVTSSHTATIGASVSAPNFSLGAGSIRCQAAGIITYTASASNTTGITYSLDAASIAGGNSINSTTGAVTYSAAWNATTTITASAAGCDGPQTSTHTVTINPSVGVPVFALGTSSFRCAGGSTITYTATATASSSITYTLDAVSTLSGSSINSSTGTVTFSGLTIGTSTITATAAGCNGPRTSTHTVTIRTPVGTPVFTLGAASTRCQPAGTVTYTATATNTSGITYSLDAASIAGGNTINSATGAVIYTPIWSGTTIITASAAGCAGPRTSTHTVSINEPLTSPIFTSGAGSTRCQGAGPVTYNATATNTTVITYSLNAAAIAGGNSINSSTGIVTYAAAWTGVTIITATASGCGGPLTATHTVTNTPTVGTPTFVLGFNSTRCNSAESITYTASSTNSTGITYTLDAASLAAGNSIDALTGEVTYVAGWISTSTITASSEGCNGPRTAVHTVTTSASVENPVFILGATSSRCQGAGTVSYAATATGTTGITYSLDAASIVAGNTINAVTGSVTFLAAWTGPSTITASAAGCDGPTTASHTVTINETVTIPLFSLGTSSIRCQGAGIETYTASANHATGITYSLNAASIAGGNTINSSTGEVSYAPSYSGTSIVTASATGCGGPRNSTHTVTVTATVGLPTFTSGVSSTRCQGAGTITYTATATNNTGISYSLDATSIAGGNSIDASTGAVTYDAAWSGVSTITASADGCNGPRTRIHTVTTTSTVGTPVFALGSSSTRCQRAGVVNYSATATAATGITYSLDAASLAGGNTINSTIGNVTYVIGWTGTSTITATAAGCNGPQTSTHTVTTTASVTTPVFAAGATSTRCQGVSTITYTASSNNTTGITYTLSAAAIAAGNTIDDVTGEVTFTAGWTGSASITASAAGCNGPINRTHTVTTTATVGNPIFILGATSTRCQGAATVAYTANASNNTGITYSLDAVSIAGGVTINTATGAVTYVAGWNGTSIITATATGCNGFATSSHTATNTPTVGLPIFASGATSTRCQGAGMVTYTASSTSSTGLTYSLNVASLAGGNTINSSTGEVTYAAGFSGTSIVTASAAGCGGPRISTHTVTVTATVGLPIFTSGASSTRCQGAIILNYAATATNSTAITYSLDAASIAGGNSINSSTGDITYAAGWIGTSTITASAAGCNGPRTSTHTVTITATVGTPTFTTGISSTRCQGAGVITYTATATNNTGIAYSLDATTDAYPGNSINTSTGTVTYVSGWSGTSTITASAVGCNGPVNSTHTVTTTATVGTPVFVSGASSTRCQGAGTVSYTATATNATGISYSLDATTLAGGNTINTATGAVTYAAGWNGTSAITATAAGCNGPRTSTHTVTTTPTVGLPFFTLGSVSTRLQGAGTVTYTANATNTTGITYSLNAASLAGGNTINSSTGAVTYNATWSSPTIITASAAGCGGPRTATHTVTVNSSSVTKQLYLSDPSQSLDRVDPVNTNDATTASTVLVSSTGTTFTTFTQAPALCSDLTIKAGTISVTNYITISSGTMPINPAITAQLRYGATNIITLSNPIYNSGLLTWTATLASDVIIPAGQAITLQVTTAEAGVIFRIDFDSQTKPSKINLPVSTYINVTALNVYSAPYPAGIPVVSGVGGVSKYIRATVTDPFGFADITGMNITITPTGSTVAATSVATSGCTRTYEYAWPTPATSGNYAIAAVAREGFESTVTHSRNTNYSICSTCAPVASNDSISGAGGTPIVVNVLANDYDPNNNINAASLAITMQPKDGSAYVSNNTIIYLPNGSFQGKDTLTYQICDLTSPIPLCSTAQIFLSIDPLIIDICADASKTHTYYIPYPEQQSYTALLASSNTSMPSNNIQTIISLKIPYPKMTIVWDEWEDGYEANALNPIQTTTKVWGDGNPFNGIAPGYSSDLIPAGGSIILDNTMNANPRNPSNIFYDGKDKIVSGGQIAVTQVSGEPTRMPVQAIKTNVTSTYDFGQSFTIPLGQDFNSRDFRYTALFIRASENNTTINIDRDNNGTFETTTTLNEGGSYLLNGGVLTGATVTSDKPIGVELNAGGVDQYSIRNAPIFPATWYSNTYYSPVPTSDNAADSPKDTSAVMFYNSLNRPININWYSGAPANGVIAVPAKSAVRFPLAYSTTAAYRFVNLGGESFTAIEIIDSYTPTTGANDGSTYDWSFNLISEARLTDYTTVAWAPGGLDLVAPAGPDVNGNPIWVTPTANTTIYVKYDGNISGTSGSVSPCGLRYDVSYPLNALNYLKIRDVTDNDQSGIAIYTCNGAKIAAAYGEDPRGSTTGFGIAYWDVGSTIQPFCKSKIIIATDDYATTLVSQPVTISVLSNDLGFLGAIDPTSVSTLGLLQPKHGTISVNDNGTILYIPNIGYAGSDTFEYNVCSTPSPIVCDVALVIVRISTCPSNGNQNIISGQIFIDRNKDALNNDGGIGLAGVKIYLYTDGNCNATINANELTDSVTVDSSGFYQFSKYPEKTVEDNFDGVAGARTCNNGTDGDSPWATNWVDANDLSAGFCNTSQPATNTDVDIFADGAFGNGLRLKDNDVSATRTANLLGATKAFLSFSYRRVSNTLVSGEDILVQASNGSGFFTIYTIAGNGTVDANPVTIFNQDITSYASATTSIRFLTNGNVDDADTVYIDNVSIRFLRYPQCYISSISASSVPATYTLTTVGQRTITINSGGTCTSQFDFGFGKPNVTVSGTLRNDVNGLVDGLVNGAAIGAPGGAAVYAYLTDVSGNVAFRATVNSSNGTYSFPLAEIQTDYTLILSTTFVALGASPPTSTFGSSWMIVGDAYGTNNAAGTGNEPGTPNGAIAVKTAMTNVTNVNIGIERLPNSNNHIKSINQPAVNQFITLNGQGMNPPVLSGSDPEDCVSGCDVTNRTVIIDTVPGNSELYYNSILVTSGQTINNFRPDSLKVRITAATMGDITISFRYSFVDAAALKDPTPATYTLIWLIPLPAEGLNAAASLNDNDAIIKWSTVSEHNTSYFEVERSIDNVSFAPTGNQVQASGESETRKDYQMKDKLPGQMRNDVVYYRVKLVDQDGKVTYSNIVVVRISKKPGVTVWPNPFISNVTISISTESETIIDVNMIDVSGKVLKTISQSVPRGISQISLKDLDQLPAGVYLMEIADKRAGTTYQKLLKNSK